MVLETIGHDNKQDVTGTLALFHLTKQPPATHDAHTNGIVERGHVTRFQPIPWDFGNIGQGNSNIDLAIKFRQTDQAPSGLFLLIINERVDRTLSIRPDHVHRSGPVHNKLNSRQGVVSHHSPRIALMNLEKSSSSMSSPRSSSILSIGLTPCSCANSSRDLEVFLGLAPYSVFGDSSGNSIEIPPLCFTAHPVEVNALITAHPRHHGDHRGHHHVSPGILNILHTNINYQTNFFRKPRFGLPAETFKIFSRISLFAIFTLKTRQENHRLISLRRVQLDLRLLLRFRL